MYFIDYQIQKNNKNFQETFEELVNLLKDKFDLSEYLKDKSDPEEIENRKKNLPEIIERFYDNNFSKIAKILDGMKKQGINWNHLLLIEMENRSTTLFESSRYKIKTRLAQRDDFEPRFINDLEQDKNPAWFELVLAYFNTVDKEISHNGYENAFMLEEEFKLLQKLLEKVDFNQKNTDGQTILHLLILESFVDGDTYSDGTINQKKVDLLKFFLERVDHDIRDVYNKLFIQNIQLKKTAFVRYLLNWHKEGVLDLNAEKDCSKNFFVLGLNRMETSKKGKNRKSVEEIDKVFNLTFDLIEKGFVINKQSLKLLLSNCQKIYRLHCHHPFPVEEKTKIVTAWEINEMKKMQKNQKEHLSIKLKML